MFTAPNEAGNFVVEKVASFAWIELWNSSRISLLYSQQHSLQIHLLVEDAHHRSLGPGNDREAETSWSREASAQGKSCIISLARSKAPGCTWTTPWKGWLMSPMAISTEMIISVSMIS